MERQPCATDLTDAQWQVLEPLLPPRRRRGRPRTVVGSHRLQAQATLQSVSPSEGAVDGPDPPHAHPEHRCSLLQLHRSAEHVGQHLRWPLFFRRHGDHVSFIKERTFSLFVYTRA